MPRLRWLMAGALWLCCVLAGFALLIRYKSTAGTADVAPLTWPAKSALKPGKGATLLMFVHPHCACSRASISEMGRLLQRIHDRVSAVRIVFVRPPGTPAGWQNTELRQRALTLPGASVVDDDGAIEAERFHASTSGTTLLYDASGRLAFHGGITPMRGHQGDSAGQERIVAIVTGGSAERNESPVFGCGLADKDNERPLAQGAL